MLGTRRAVLAGLGLCYLVAFASFGVQLRGLIGPNGLEPAAASNAFLLGLCWFGAIASLGLALDAAAEPCAIACWALYLSLAVAGGDFMSYQWDMLLLEAGLIAAFLAPRAGPTRGAIWLLRLLLIKLMLQSGSVKLLSGDPAWRNLTALTYHYWTQPLPTPTAWRAAQFPLLLQKLSCAAMFAVELGAPWLLLGPRRARAAGAAAIAGLMLLIALTGNYGFFNLLTIVLCVAALDDSFLGLARLAPKATPRPAPRWRARLFAVFAAVWLLVSGLTWAQQVGLRPPLRQIWGPALAAVEPLRSINAYGLFAVMTTARDELSIEVSADGRDWREWPFRWKPGDPRRAPPIVAPHMPRLDWQMWFAALGAPSPWLGRLIEGLLRDNPDVEALMGPSPLDGRKPRFARVSVWSMRFSTPAERRAEGVWWVRERKALSEVFSAN